MTKDEIKRNAPSGANRYILLDDGRVVFFKIKDGVLFADTKDGWLVAPFLYLIESLFSSYVFNTFEGVKRKLMKI